MQCFINPLSALYLQYTLPTYATLTCAHKCNQFLILHKIHSQVSTNTTCTKLREHFHITSSDRGEMGFVVRFTLHHLQPYKQPYFTLRIQCSIPGVGKLVKWQKFLQKTKNSSEPHNQFVVSIQIQFYSKCFTSNLVDSLDSNLYEFV